MRASKEIIKEIEYETGIYSDKRCYKPNKKSNHFRGNFKAKFYCRCGREWTSGLVSIELWWKKNSRNKKKAFDVRLYGQKCKICNKKYLRPYIYESDIDRLIDKFSDILLSNKKFRKRNFNNHQDNSERPHDQGRCQKCNQLGYPCWIKKNDDNDDYDSYSDNDDYDSYNDNDDYDSYDDNNDYDRYKKRDYDINENYYDEYSNYYYDY